jgi:hypothetical protein
MFGILRFLRESLHRPLAAAGRQTTRFDQGSLHVHCMHPTDLKTLLCKAYDQESMVS